MRRKIGDVWGTAISLGSLGWLALRQHDFRRMRELLSESLVIRRDSGDTGGCAWCLEKLAEAAVLQGQAAPAAARGEHFRHAARWLGAAAALRAPLGSAIDEVDQPEHERQIAVLRAGLGDAAFAAAWAEGSAMNLNQAVEDALSETAVPPEAGEAMDDNYGGLTPREREVAALIRQGRSNRYMAEALVVSVRTVETYVTRILSKLGFDSRVQIATWAVEKGLARPNKD